MGDTINIPWQLANTAKDPLQTSQDSALAGLKIGQARAGINALRGLDLDDPSSVNAAITASVRAGLTDQASALMGLNLKRDLVTRLPGVLDRIGGKTEAPSDQTSAAPDAAHASETMGLASKAVGDLLNTPEADRQAKFDSMKQAFLDRGVPAQAIDAVGSDLSTAHLQSLQENFAGHQSHFDNGGTGTPPALHPTTQSWYQQALNDPQMLGTLNLGKSMFGYDTGIPEIAERLGLPGIQAQANIGQAGPVASAQQAAITAAQPQQLAQQAVGAGQKALQEKLVSLGLDPQIAGQVAAAQEAARAPYDLVPGITGPNGEPLYRTRADVAAGRVPSQGASPATMAASGVTGTQNAQQAVALQARAADVPMRRATLENMRQSAGDFHSGPQSGFWKTAGQLAAEYGVRVPGTPSTDATASQEEFDKLSIAVLAAQRGAMGLPVTDASSVMTAGAVPNERLTPKGIQRVTGLMIGNEDYLGAQNRAWQTWSKLGHGGETFGDFQTQFNQLFDPRVFQSQYMSPDQRARVRASVGPKTFDRQEAAAKKLGYIGRAE